MNEKIVVWMKNYVRETWNQETITLWSLFGVFLMISGALTFGFMGKYLATISGLMSNVFAFTLAILDMVIGITLAVAVLYYIEQKYHGIPLKVSIASFMSILLIYVYVIFSHIWAL